VSVEVTKVVFEEVMLFEAGEVIVAVVIMFEAEVIVAVVIMFGEEVVISYSECIVCCKWP
jgi:hypothetical protein